MTATTQIHVRAGTGLGAILAIAFIGLATVFVAGHAQSAMLHDAAHDVRHAAGFPWH